jgi:hypothetical protein
MNKDLQNMIEKENLAKLLGVQPENISELSPGSIYQLLCLKYFGNVKEQSKDNFVTEDLFLSTMMNKYLRKGVSRDA